ncbi:MAG: molybdopterin cofactor-binding domain-containing protein, partial [Pseudomonadota bacterium]
MTTRRAFILGSAAVAGGVAVGVVLHREGRGSVQPPLEPGQVAITPYVIVDAEGIALISPRAEMGQGIQTTLAALVAEELDVDFDAIHVRHGPASELYANDIMYGTGPRPFWKRRPHRPRQATGGQTSIRDGFVKMRKAGAAARMMLLEAASRTHDLPVEELSTRMGSVVHTSGRAFSYASLAAVAATLPAPADPPLKPRSEWRLLGTSLPRADMVEKCTGTAEYGIDVRLPDMLHATVRRNPRLGGTMTSFDATQALSAPGVSDIVSLRDGVIVIASNTWYAMRAVDLIEFDWGPAPYPDTTAEHEAIVLSTMERGPAFDALERGNVDSSLDAGQVISGEYRVPFLAHAPLEPMNATAWLRDGRLDIWAGNQFPDLAVEVGAKLTGLARDAVRVHTTYMGGAFGRRFEMDDVEAAVRAAMATPGRPVKVTYSRGEDLTHDAYRPMAMARFRATIAEGKPQALDLELASPSLQLSGGRRMHRMIGRPYGETR